MNTAAILMMMLSFALFLLVCVILLARHRFQQLARKNTWTLRLTKSGKAIFEWVRDVRGGVKYPDGRVVLTGPSRVFNTEFPPTGYPSVVKVRTGLAVITEGNGAAFDPWERDPIVADVQMGAAYDESTIKGALLTLQSELDKLAGKHAGGLKPLYLYIAIGVIVIGFLVMGVYLYQISGQLSYIQTAFGL